MELVDQRSEASWLRMEYAASERRVCGLLTMGNSGTDGTGTIVFSRGNQFFSILGNGIVRKA